MLRSFHLIGKIPVSIFNLLKKLSTPVSLSLQVRKLTKYPQDCKYGIIRDSSTTVVVDLFIKKNLSLYKKK